MSANNDQKCRELFEIVMSLGREIRCCSRDEAICGGVTFHQFVILDAVVKNQGLDLAALHKLLAVEKSTTTRLVNPLLQKGLLKRDRAEHDSRAVKLTLTEEGRETRERVWMCLEVFFGNITRNIPEEGQEEILEAVKVFTAAMTKAAVECRCCEKVSQIQG